MFTTKTSEISVKWGQSQLAQLPATLRRPPFVILAKALRPPPANGTDSKTRKSATASVISI